MTNVPEPVINRPAETAPEEVRRAKCNARGEIKRMVAPESTFTTVLAFHCCKSSTVPALNVTIALFVTFSELEPTVRVAVICKFCPKVAVRSFD